VALSEIGIEEDHWYDLYGKRGWMAEDQWLELTLQPYDVLWLMPFEELERRIEA
jgi:sucrose phosphorylase